MTQPSDIAEALAANMATMAFASPVEWRAKFVALVAHALKSYGRQCEQATWDKALQIAQVLDGKGGAYHHAYERERGEKPGDLANPRVLPLGVARGTL